MIGNYIYRRRVAGRWVYLCERVEDLPRTARRYLACDVPSTVDGRHGRVWVDLYRCEGRLYGVPRNGLEARNL